MIECTGLDAECGQIQQQRCYEGEYHSECESCWNSSLLLHAKVRYEEENVEGVERVIRRQ